MALVNKNSSFDAHNVVFNVSVNPLFYRRFSSTLKAWTNSILVVPTSRVSRFSAHRNANMTPPLELTKRPTARILSTSFRPRVAKRTIRSHASPLPSIVEESFPFVLEVPPPSPLLLIFAVSLLSKNLKWTKNSSILLVFLTIPQRHVGPCNCH
jgi:hypothetical protein